MTNTDADKEKARLDELFQRAINEFSGTPVMAVDPADSVRAGAYQIRVTKDEFYPGSYVGRVYGPASPGPILETRGNPTKVSAVISAIADFKSTHSAEARQLDEAFSAKLQAWHHLKTTGGGGRPIRQSVKLSRLPEGFKLKHDLEPLFKKVAAGANQTVAILGDEMYVKRYKMPKWNRQVTILDDPPHVAIHHWPDLGSTSKHAHRLRAEHFEALQKTFHTEHSRLVTLAEKKYGAEGPLISGGQREHWPMPVRDRVRFLAQGGTILNDAARLHMALSKTRSSLFK